MKQETTQITVGDQVFEATQTTLEPDLQNKQVKITENKTTAIVADDGYDGLDEVEVETDVQGGIDPSQATAQPSDVAYSKTFYAGNEVEKTGTLEEYAGATTITTNGELATANKILRNNLTIAVSDSGGASTDIDLFATGNLYDLLTDYFVNQLMLGTALIKGGIKWN